MPVPPAPSPSGWKRTHSSFGIFMLAGAVVALLWFSPGASSQSGAQRPGGGAQRPAPSAIGVPGDPGQEVDPLPNVIRSISRRALPAGVAGPGPSSLIEIEATVPASVGAGNERVTLNIGGQLFVQSRVPPDGDASRVIFMLTPDQFARLRTGDPVSVQHGFGGPGRVWDFGRLDKGMLRRP